MTRRKEKIILTGSLVIFFGVVLAVISAAIIVVAIPCPSKNEQKEFI